MGDPGIALPGAADAVRAFYDRHGRPAMVQVEVDSDADRWFDAAGWSVVPGGDSLFMLGSLSRSRRLLSGRAAEAAQLEVDGLRARAAVGDLASGKASVDGDWLGVHGLWVEPDVRRRGLGRAVMDALLEWGAEQGATTLWLHVETDNAPAIALYESLGLDVHHGCRYLAFAT
jgi:ribosomal protein S18 acetylase RimI-like enzyme